MRVSVFGLGYVGSVSAACIARDGRSVVGVDPNPSKLEQINAGRAPLIEPGLDELVESAVRSGRLRAVADPHEAVRESDISLVCVGTPSEANGSLSLTYLRRVCEQIGAALREKSDRHVVVIRSTVLPGTTEETVIPILETHSGKQAGRGFGVCVNPEFLREGSAVLDFDAPGRTVIGETDEASGALVAELYANLDAPVLHVAIPLAEMVKYCDNTWHALKIAFANEVGNIAKAHGIDSHALMDIFCSDTKLNISRSYLKPGQAFGGSCLPKDVRALTYRARALDVEAPVLNAILPSNALQIERSVQMVLDRGNRRVGILGFSFKAGTDDLRESPVVELAERLIGKGYDLRLYDRNVHLAKLTGANQEFIMQRLPHISRLMVDRIESILEHAQTIVVGTHDPQFVPVLERLRPDQHVIDLVRIVPKARGAAAYEGSSW